MRDWVVGSRCALYTMWVGLGGSAPVACSWFLALSRSSGSAGRCLPFRVVVVVGVLGVAAFPRASSSWCSCSIMSCVCVACVVFLACHVLGRGCTACACTSYCVLSHARVHHLRGWQVAYLLPLASVSPGFCSPAVVHCTNCALYANRSASAMWKSCGTQGRPRWCVAFCHVLVGCGTLFSENVAVVEVARHHVAASSRCAA